MEFLEFPESWGKLKDVPKPEQPKDLETFLNSVKVTEEELFRTTLVKAMFTIPEELKHLK